MLTNFVSSFFTPPLAISPLHPTVVLPYKNEYGHLRWEMVAAKKEGIYYRVKSIPFYAVKIAPGDLLDTTERDGVLYYHRIVGDGGHSVIQMQLFTRQPKQIARQLRHFGCPWHLAPKKHRLAFAIPKEVAYLPVKHWLDLGEEQGHWAYCGACLSHD